MLELNSGSYSNYRLLIVGGQTDGLTDFFSGVNLQSLIGRSLLIKNITFIPRYLSNMAKVPEVQFYDATAAGNDYYQVTPNNVNPGTRIVSANVEFDGLDFRFSINGKRLQLVEGSTSLLTFDNIFSNVNIFIPDKINDMSLFAEELIYTNVATGTTGRYFLQVNMELLINPTTEQLAGLILKG